MTISNKGNKKKILSNWSSIVKKTDKTIGSNFKTALDNTRLAIAKQAEKGALNKEGIVKYNRMEKLTSEVDDIIDDVWDEAYEDLDDAYFETYQTTFVETAFYFALAMNNGDKKKANADMKKEYNIISKKDIKNNIDDVFNGKFTKMKKELYSFQMRTDVRNQIINGIKQGLSVPEMARNIKGIINKNMNWALRIARTDTHQALNLSHLEYEERLTKEGYKFKKIWLSTIDNRTREDHLNADGKEANDDGLFEVGGETMPEPGLGSIPENNINCRCTSYLEMEIEE